ncbi:SPFH/Band 7/PHB domain protein [Candidatus Pacearchaeota archaeon]|nr:SPFH/Band 7/PHB domain protein [Candidatus Pacearchaeota archaeon]
MSLIPLVTVRPTERAVIERFGKYKGCLNPGLHFIIPIVDHVYFVNITEQMVDAEKQEVITGDNLNCTVDAQIYFKVKEDEANVKASQYNVDNYYRQIVAITRTTLRDIIGKKPFKEVNSERGKLNKVLEQELEGQTKPWGISVVRTEIKEIEPPEDVQETMNKVLKAENEKRSAVDFATAKETEADGKKRAEIKKAEGVKRAMVLSAEGAKQKQELEAKGKAEAIKLVNESAQKYFKDQAVEYEKLQKLEKTLSKNTKFVIPSDSPLMDVVSMMLGAKATKEKK